MRRVTELDAVRGLAAVSIMVYHLRLPKAFHGWTRVDLFFVLSGYLVTSAVLRDGNSRGFYTRFLLRRLRRLAPAYFLALLALVAVNPFLPTPAPLDALPQYLTFTQNVQHYWGGAPPAFSPHFFHTWSLALDVQFYLIWPLLVRLAGRRHLIPLTVPFVVVPALARSAGILPYIVLTRCDGFALGGLLAAVLDGREGGPRHARALPFAFAAAGLAGIAITIGGMVAYWDILHDRPLPWLGMTILAVDVVYASLIGLLVCHSGHPALGILRDRRLRHLGTISYGIYLFHPIAFRAVELVGRNLGVGRCLLLEVLMLAAGLLVAALSWECVERPILASRKISPP